MSLIGDKLLDIRTDAALTQQEVADAAGIDVQWLNAIETGEREVRAATARRIAGALGMTLSEAWAHEIV